MRGQRLGLLGFGRIGMAVAERAKACGFNIVFFDPNVPDGVDKVRRVRRVVLWEVD